MTALPSYSLPKSTLWLMTIATGLIVANNYYNQPLLALIAADVCTHGRGIIKT